VTPGIDKSRFLLRRAEAAALILLAASAIFYASVLRPSEERLAQLERALGQRAAASQGLLVNGGQKDTAAKLAAFYAFFDRGLTYTDWLTRFYDIAARTGVQVLQAQYTRTARPDVPLVLYDVTLPVSGDYRNVRAFAEGVLSAIPVAALDHISFRRKEPGQDVIDADLKFTFYIPVSAPPL